MNRACNWLELSIPETHSNFHETVFEQTSWALLKESSPDTFLVDFVTRFHKNQNRVLPYFVIAHKDIKLFGWVDFRRIPFCEFAVTTMWQILLILLTNSYWNELSFIRQKNPVAGGINDAIQQSSVSTKLFFLIIAISSAPSAHELLKNLMVFSTKSFLSLSGAVSVKKDTWYLFYRHQE